MDPLDDFDPEQGAYEVVLAYAYVCTYVRVFFEGSRTPHFFLGTNDAKMLSTMLIAAAVGGAQPSSKGGHLHN